MENNGLLSASIADAWSRPDFPHCLALLQEAVQLRGAALHDIAAVLALFEPRFDCVPKEHHVLAAHCLDIHAEILRLAAEASPVYSIAALRALIERGRLVEGLAFLPAALRQPDFIDIVSLACTALYSSGKQEEALALLRDRLRESDCRYFYVTELVKIGRLTGEAEKEFATLDRILQTEHQATGWQIAYYSQLGIALRKQSIVAETLHRLATQPAYATAAHLGFTELHIEDLALDAAFARLQTPLEQSELSEWRDALQHRLAQLVAAHLASHEWQQARAAVAHQRPRIALTLSGFVRSYEGLASLFSFLKRHVEKWDIEIFAHSFDRLGNLYMRTQNLGNLFYDYGHGGFYREIMKTPPLRVETLKKLLAPVSLQIEARQPDDYYLKSIGLAHPQWLAVWQAWQLFERHRIATGNAYRFAIRGRYDKNYDTVDLDRLDLRDDQIATAANDFYGRPPHTINDQFAIGSATAMRTYCRIGEGRNFKDLESSQAWQNECAGAEFSHETHLALWLNQNGIESVRPDWLRIAY